VECIVLLLALKAVYSARRFIDVVQLCMNQRLIPKTLHPLPILLNLLADLVDLVNLVDLSPLLIHTHRSVGK